MDKRIHSIRINDEDAHKLKIMAAEARKTMGDVFSDILQAIEQKADQRRQLLLDAGLKTYAKQPTLSLALMADSTIQDMLNKASELSKPAQYGWSDEDVEDGEW